MTIDPEPLRPDPERLLVTERGLLTDLYQLTMGASYLAEGATDQATFSLIVRKLPDDRGYLVMAGLEDALRYLEELRFPPEAIEYLDSLQLFPRQFLDYLASFRFEGEVRAVPEGRVCFAGEPLVEVTAPIIHAQLAETAVLNQVHYQTVLATKAARCVDAARGRVVVDFALRRTPGFEAGLKLARACYLVGFASTSNVLAGRAYGMPVAGTMAHSYITALPSEIEAFRAFARLFPRNTVLLIDTYDTVAGARKAATVGQELAAAGYRLRGVRLDSGDMIALSREVRAILDAAGLQDAMIFASGGFDEYEIARAVEAGAPIDAFGVGTRLGVSADAPYLDVAYKLAVYAGRPVRKLSLGKATLAGEKQVWRRRDRAGRFVGDVVGLRGEPAPAGDAEPLLETVMVGGRAVQPRPTLDELRARFQADFAALDPRYRRIRGPERYPVEYTSALTDIQQRAGEPR